MHMTLYKNTYMEKKYIYKMCIYIYKYIYKLLP